MTFDEWFKTSSDSGSYYGVAEEAWNAALDEAIKLVEFHLDTNDAIDGSTLLQRLGNLNASKS